MTRIARWASAAAAVVASLGAFAAPAHAVGPDQYGGYHTQVFTAGCPSSAAIPPAGPRTGDRLAIDADSAAAYYRCTPSTGGAPARPERVTCAPGAFFDWSRGVCAPARKVPEMGTKLTAGKAQLIPQSATRVKLGKLNATLVRDRDNGPQDAVWNATITFTDGEGKVLCVARTDASGRASCDTKRSLFTPEALLGGYTAEYAGNGGVKGEDNTLAPATAQGSVL